MNHQRTSGGDTFVGHCVLCLVERSLGKTTTAGLDAYACCVVLGLRDRLLLVTFGVGWWGVVVLVGALALGAGGLVHWKWKQ